jgi:hypothetical protein
MTKQEIQQKAFELTAVFETSSKPPRCYGVSCGNSDKQGMSYGPLQWNLGQETLQPIIRKLCANYPDMMREIFKDRYEELRSIFSPQPTPIQVKWGNSISDPKNKRRLISPWPEMFMALGATKECQQAMIAAAQWYIDNAWKEFTALGFKTGRAYALMYDIMVQNGSISPEVKERTRRSVAALAKDIVSDPLKLEVEKMKLLAKYRAEASNEESVEDVRSRKMTIAEGKGVVHGIKVDLDKDFGITLNYIH